LRTIVDTTLDLMDHNITQVSADVVLSRSKQPLLLKGNRMRLEQVATNILRNALDAVEGRSTRQINISMGREDADIWFEVADTGHGLGDRSLEDLREPFATTRESGKGMGLGLTISAGIVSDHGGTITAHDRISGGAVFRITLPEEPEGQIA
ncbi:MAG: ATP-binding protein, partial [Pseudomonadota bacterium]